MNIANQKAKFDVITMLGKTEAQLELLTELQPSLHPDIYWKKRRELLIDRNVYSKVLTMAITL
jgi:hypothetical protein